MDQFDRAQELDAHYRQQALEMQRKDRPQGEARTQCLECGKKIPEARRKAVPGCSRCRDCAELFEVSRRRG